MCSILKGSHRRLIRTSADKLFQAKSFEPPLKLGIMVHPLGCHMSPNTLA